MTRRRIRKRELDNLASAVPAPAVVSEPKPAVAEPAPVVKKVKKKTKKKAKKAILGRQTDKS